MSLFFPNTATIFFNACIDDNIIGRLIISDIPTQNVTWTWNLYFCNFVEQNDLCLVELWNATHFKKKNILHCCWRMYHRPSVWWATWKIVLHSLMMIFTGIVNSWCKICSYVPHVCSNSRDRRYQAKPSVLKRSEAAPWRDLLGVLVEKTNLGFAWDWNDGSPIISTPKHGLSVLSTVDVGQWKACAGSFFWFCVNTSAQKCSRLPWIRPKEKIPVNVEDLTQWMLLMLNIVFPIVFKILSNSEFPIPKSTNATYVVGELPHYG